MKIISGRLKGRNVYAPKGNDVRPTSDKVRGCIFDTLQSEVEGCRFIDLFAGSGAVGIEAYSRGASEVVFCERSGETLACLKNNVALMPPSCARVIHGDFADALMRLTGKYDIIFADPPYKDDYLEDICAIVDRRDILAEDGMIVYEHAVNKPPVIPAGYRVVKSKRYGNIALEYIIKGGTVCAVTGSFDPLTKGHMRVIEKARSLCDEVVVVIAVNENKPRLFTLEESKEIVCAAVENMTGVSVDICEGYVYKYCNKRAIPLIVRGIRNDEDRSYEDYMAEYNKKKGGIETLFVDAGDYNDISSTKVRAALAEGDMQTLENMCVKSTLKLIKDKFGLRRKEETND